MSPRTETVKVRVTLPRAEIMRALAQPFPKKFIHENPSGGGSYIKHHVIEQRLIQVLGVPPSFEKVEILFGDVAGYTTSNGKQFPDLRNVVVGVIARMTLNLDGEKVVVEEAGDCEQPHNWKTDGQRLKDAMSDAYKRCAMRLGCGLHLWSQDEYFLFDELSKSQGSESPASPPSASEPTAGEGLAPGAGNGETPAAPDSQEALV